MSQNKRITGTHHNEIQAITRFVSRSLINFNSRYEMLRISYWAFKGGTKRGPSKVDDPIVNEDYVLSFSYEDT